ncbi:hypothetical protein LZ31DRAFT_51834 [Colletotrichum somersetense]|nr:hypothetical protein LZ31DRAFT_51834 [Colletotrichum somersetense]
MTRLVIYATRCWGWVTQRGHLFLAPWLVGQMAAMQQSARAVLLLDGGGAPERGRGGGGVPQKIAQLQVTTGTRQVAALYGCQLCCRSSNGDASVRSVTIYPSLTNCDGCLQKKRGFGGGEQTERNNWGLSDELDRSTRDNDCRKWAKVVCRAGAAGRSGFVDSLWAEDRSGVREDFWLTEERQRS